MTALGIFGGTFNPVHIGHLRGGIAARDVLGLDHVRFMPAALPPLKDRPEVSAEHRRAMLSLAVEDLDGFSVDGRELERDGLSYTIDSLQQIRGEVGARVSLTFIVGSDSVARLHRWHQWQDMMSVANLAILVRPDAPEFIHPDVLAWIKHHEVEPSAWQRPVAGAICHLKQPQLQISSSSLRADIDEGKNISFLLPSIVIEYIQSHGLYRS